MKLLIHTDGGSRGNPGNAAIGIVVTDGLGKIVHKHSAFLGVKTNNEAEYEALLYAAGWISRFSTNEAVECCVFHLDSLLVVSQVLGKWKIKQPHLQKYRQQIVKLLHTLSCDWQILHVPREKNVDADLLVNQSLDSHLNIL